MWTQVSCSKFFHIFQPPISKKKDNITYQIIFFISILNAKLFTLGRPNKKIGLKEKLSAQ